MERRSVIEPGSLAWDVLIGARCFPPGQPVLVVRGDFPPEVRVTVGCRKPGCTSCGPDREVIAAEGCDQ